MAHGRVVHLVDRGFHSGRERTTASIQIRSIDRSESIFVYSLQFLLQYCWYRTALRTGGVREMWSGYPYLN